NRKRGLRREVAVSEGEVLEVLLLGLLDLINLFRDISAELLDLRAHAIEFGALGGKPCLANCHRLLALFERFAIGAQFAREVVDLEGPEIPRLRRPTLGGFRRLDGARVGNHGLASLPERPETGGDTQQGAKQRGDERAAEDFHGMTEDILGPRMEAISSSNVCSARSFSRRCA